MAYIGFLVVCRDCIKERRIKRVGDYAVVKKVLICPVCKTHCIDGYWVAACEIPDGMPRLGIRSENTGGTHQDYATLGRGIVTFDDIHQAGTLRRGKYVQLWQRGECIRQITVWFDARDPFDTQNVSVDPGKAQLIAELLTNGEEVTPL